MPKVRLIDANALAESDMAKLIDRYLYNQCNLTVGLAAALTPEIEAEPVRHGHWENIPGMNNTVFCSECLAAANKELAMKYKGCPFCLARMDGGADNGD